MLCAKSKGSKRQMICPETTEVCLCVYKFNTQNGACLIAAWAVCKQHSISLMNTVLTRALIQLAQNKMERGSGCVGEEHSEFQVYLFVFVVYRQKGRDTQELLSFYKYHRHHEQFPYIHKVLSKQGCHLNRIIHSMDTFHLSMLSRR